jgi:flagellar biosynthetic protein FliP
MTRIVPFATAAVAVLLGAGSAVAQSLSVDLGQGGSVSGQIIRLVLLITVLSLAPSILVMVTSFTRIVIVLSFLRTAIGLQQTPPNPVLIGLALFLTLFVMTPTLETAWRDGLEPMLAEEIDDSQGLERASGRRRRWRRSRCACSCPPS